MLHKLFRSLVVALVVGATATPAMAIGSSRAGLEADDPEGVDAEPIDDPEGVDTELIDALAGVGLVDQWTSIGTLDSRAMLVVVSGASIEDLRRQLIDDAVELAEVRPVGRRLLVLLAQLDEVDEQLQSEHAHVEARAAVTSLGLKVIDDALAHAAIARYVRGTNLPPVGDDLDAVYTDATHSTLVDVAVEDLLTRHRVLTERLDGFAREASELDEAMSANADTRRDATDELETLRPKWDGLESSVSAQLGELSESRMGGTVQGLNLSLVTLDAYLTGEAVLTELRPECGLRWQAIAAIARVESNHGRDRGGRVLPDGRLSSPFLGVLLDGSVEGTQVVNDTDGGAIDGDPEFDRAVGPFQFLPGSWRSGGIDGNDDGVVDVNNLYDGAASAAEYLCSRVPGLTDDGALRQSFLTYNNSGDYADAVVGWVRTYDEFQIDTDQLGASAVDPSSSN